MSHTREWQRPIECHIFLGHFPQKIPHIIGGSFAKRDLQLIASYASLLHPVHHRHSVLTHVHMYDPEACAMHVRVE